MSSSDRVFVIVNALFMIALVVCIVRSLRSPSGRGYVLGFVLVAVGLVSLTLYQLRVIPREWGLAARLFSVGIALWGGVLVLRLWNSQRSSDRPSS